MTTSTSTLRTLSSGLNTSGSSHDPEIFIGGTTFLVGLASLNDPCPLELIMDCPPLPLRSTEGTNAAEELFPPPAPVSTNTSTGMRQLVQVRCHTNARTHTCLVPTPMVARLRVANAGSLYRGEGTMETSSAASSPLLLTYPPLVVAARWILPLSSPPPRSCARCSLRLLFPREEPPGAHPQARETREAPSLALLSSIVYALNILEHREHTRL